ncbi:MAG TPA: magnesium/cobalt transporter CorA [Anaeromyxobacteraceae bacterium]|nr:magnesium/cobalt transporter CorA [Anaeromyxobacteraceae bacterium]
MLRAIRLEGEEIRPGGREVCQPGAPFWADLSPDPENLAWLSQRFGFHPLALEDCVHLDQRAKFEEYPGALFAVVHRLSPLPDDSGLQAHEVHCFLTPEALVTVHWAVNQEVDRVFGRCAADPALLGRGADFALYLLLDAVTDAHFAVADALTDEIDDLSAQVASQEADGELMGRILAARRAHAFMRRRLSPQREVMAALARPGDGRIKDRNAVYFRDVLDHLVRITEEIDTGRDLLASTMDAHLSIVNNRLNAVMTRLAVFSTIFLPLTFMTGFFGMNVQNLPEPWGMVVMIGAMIALPPAMVYWFRRMRWM